jgi:uncharacterized protein YidB (DUF937 family)
VVLSYEQGRTHFVLERIFAMGLMDILNGMQNGPRGGSSNQSSGQSSGMSPITMALLALLAYKAVKSMGGSQTQTAPSGNAPAPQQGGPSGNDLGSILGGLLPGGLGGALGGGLGGLLGGLLGGGASSGGALRGGLDDLLRQFEQNGHGDATKSWVGNGSNQTVSPDDIRNTLGDDTVNSLAEQAGVSQVDLLNGLSHQLPEFVNRLTPDGRIPTHDEMSRMMRD